jgi:carbonic anhydrase
MAMTKILEEVMAANAKYAENFGDKGTLPLPPSRRFAILTCMDARLDPAKYAGLAEGGFHAAGGLKGVGAASVVGSCNTAVS